MFSWDRAVWAFFIRADLESYSLIFLLEGPQQPSPFILNVSKALNTFVVPWGWISLTNLNQPSVAGMCFCQNVNTMIGRDVLTYYFFTSSSLSRWTLTIFSVVGLFPLNASCFFLWGTIRHEVGLDAPLSHISPVLSCLCLAPQASSHLSYHVMGERVWVVPSVMMEAGVSVCVCVSHFYN